MDLRAHFAKRLDDRFGRGAGSGLHIVVRDQVAGHLAGKLADGVGPHSVGDHEDVPPLPPSLLVRRADGREAILIIRATHARVGRGGVDDDVVPVHSLTLFSCQGSLTTRSSGGRSPAFADESHDTKNRPRDHQVFTTTLNPTTRRSSHGPARRA